MMLVVVVAVVLMATVVMVQTLSLSLCSSSLPQQSSGALVDGLHIFTAIVLVATQGCLWKAKCQWKKITITNHFNVLDLFFFCKVF